MHFDSNYKCLSDKQQFRRMGFSHCRSDAINLNLASAMGISPSIGSELLQSLGGAMLRP
jgi:hypothetical protein